MRRACRGNLPTADEIRNPEYWRGRAGKVRAVADSLRDPASRRTMLGIAASYDALAQSAERRIETSAVKQRSRYRLSFLDGADLIRDFRRVACTTDDDAIAAADALLCDYPAVEVWCSMGLVRRVLRSARRESTFDDFSPRRSRTLFATCLRLVGILLGR